MSSFHNAVKENVISHIVSIVSGLILISSLYLKDIERKLGYATLARKDAHVQNVIRTHIQQTIIRTCSIITTLTLSLSLQILKKASLINP